MTATANALFTVALTCAVSIAVALLALALRKATDKNWGKVGAGVLATAVGIRTLFVGHIGHWLYSPQMSASGAQARVVGALILLMGVTILWSWLNERQKTEESDGNSQ
jgi:hypothetical protein